MAKMKPIAEVDALMALQQTHGYMLMYMPRKTEDVTTVIRGLGGPKSKTRIEPMRCVMLAVPMTSELAKALPPRTKKKATP